MNTIHSIDEYLDLVDENDQVVDKKKRSEVYAEHLSNFLVKTSAAKKHIREKGENLKNYLEQK